MEIKDLLAEVISKREQAPEKVKEQYDLDVKVKPADGNPPAQLCSTNTVACSRGTCACSNFRCR